MSRKIIQPFENITPFLILGIFIALIIGFFITFFYILIWGFLLGTLLWALASIKNLLFPAKGISNVEESSKGRTFDHNDPN
ncbi:MAG: hypothetical protein H0U70_11530 [Tatlockia sp.]|nr:hypothetical protein [Tatlockia sp.]